MALQQLYQETSRLIQKGQTKSAIAKLQKQLDLTPSDEITLSILGSAFMRQGDIDDAFKIFNKAIEYHPNSYAAHGDMAFAQMKVENTEQAITSFERATTLNPGFYQALCFLSKLYFDKGDFKLSRETYGRSHSCDPFDADYKTIQSDINASRFAQAEETARKILSQLTGHPKAAHALAHLATTVGAYEESAKILRHALKYCPADNILRVALIASLEKIADYQNAAIEAELSAALDPQKASGWQVLGRMYSHCGEYEKSLKAYDRALTCTPLTDLEKSNLQLLRGHILRTTGDSEHCIEAYLSSIKFSPENGTGWWGLADMKTYLFSEEDRAIMEKLSNNEKIDPAQRTQAAFSLGKAFEDDENYEKAFAWYKIANDLRPNVKFDATVFQNICDENNKIFTTDFLKHQASPLQAGPTPIFIVGLPRAGSTLIEQILASHSLIEGTMELPNLPNIVRRINIEGGKKKVAYPLCLSGFTAKELAEFGQAYLDETAMYRTDKPYFIDKMPPNFELVGLIHMILPNAIIIDARRYPLDGGFSCFKQHFAGGHEFSYNLENIGHYYNCYLSVMDHWDSVLPGKVKCVQYENMIANTADEITSLLLHCGVNVEEQCFEFYKNKRAVRTASSQQVRQPIYNKSKGVWHNYKQQLQPLSNALGAKTLERFKDYAGFNME
ncbi:MAG: sulfotransferase [Emcibacter sp.]|nr:sulfotransferase [Emcibacter sp.]